LQEGTGGNRLVGEGCPVASGYGLMAMDWRLAACIQRIVASATKRLILGILEERSGGDSWCWNYGSMAGEARAW
jgi:hypothetical protein